MPRHNLKKYDPKKESTPGREAEGKLVLDVSGGKCLCGCDEKPSGKKSLFRMGHDARLRGKLIRAHLTETPVVLIEGEARPIPATTALEVAERYGWQDSLLAAESRREQANKKVAHKALGSKRLVKIGRWEYTGQVVAFYRNGEDKFEVEYVTKLGDVKRTLVNAKTGKVIR